MSGESTELGQPSPADLVLRAQLRDCYGVETVRFLWQADSSGRLIKLSPEFEMITGRPCANLLGQPISQFIQKQDFPLDLALKSQTSLTGIVAVWPLARAEAWIPSSLGIVRNIGAKGVGLGISGFGLLHLNQAFIHQDLKLTRQETSHEITGAPVQSACTNVIPLRRQSKLQYHNKTHESVLSETELSAFNEIALALINDASHEEKITPFSSQPFPDESGVSDGDRLDLTSLLDRLPIGVTVSRKKELLFANNFVLQEFGYEDFTALIKDGGVSKVFGAHDPDDLVKASKFIRGDLEASGLAAEWGDASATVTLILKKSLEIDQNRHYRDGAKKVAQAAPICIENDAANPQKNFSNQITAIISVDGRIEHVTTRFAEFFVCEKVTGLARYLGPFLNSQTQAAIIRAIDCIRGGAKETVELISWVDPEKSEVLLSCAPQALGKIHVSLRYNIQEFLNVRSDNSIMDDHVSGDHLSPLQQILESIFAQNEKLFMEQSDSLNQESHVQKIKNIRSSIAQALLSIDDYLKASQSQSIAHDFVISSAAINELVAACVAQTQSLAREKKVVIRLALAPESIFIRANVPSLRRALLCILTNAVQFNMAGGQVIVSTAISDHQSFSIKIKDTGVSVSGDEIITALDSSNRPNGSRQSAYRNIYLTEPEKLIERSSASFSIISEEKRGNLIIIDFPLSDLPAAE